MILPEEASFEEPVALWSSSTCSVHKQWYGRKEAHGLLRGG